MKPISRLDTRFVAVVTILLGVALVLQARSRNEVIAPRSSLSQFPITLGSWTGTDIPLDKETLDILGPGDFLVRDYRDQAEAQPPVDLFIAYFPSQRAGDTIHSPKNCLPGAGWRPVESSRTTLTLPGMGSFPVNRYVIAKADSRQLVYYWYQAHGRVVASEYSAKFYLIYDAIRMNRSDGSLVRISSPLASKETIGAAEGRIVDVAQQIVPLLDNYVPR